MRRSAAVMRARNCTVYNFKHILRYFGLDQSGGPTDGHRRPCEPRHWHGFKGRVRIKAEAQISSGTIAFPLCTFILLHIQFVCITLRSLKFINGAQKHRSQSAKYSQILTTVQLVARIRLKKILCKATIHEIVQMRFLCQNAVNYLFFLWAERNHVKWNVISGQQMHCFISSAMSSACSSSKWSFIPPADMMNRRWERCTFYKPRYLGLSDTPEGAHTQPPLSSACGPGSPSALSPLEQKLCRKFGKFSFPLLWQKQICFLVLLCRFMVSKRPRRTAQSCEIQRERWSGKNRGIIL